MNLMDVRDRIKEIPIRHIITDRLCPSHEDHSPGSFVLNEKTNTWYCFSCNAHGDAIHFMKEKHGMNFVEAVSHIAITQGIVSRAEMEEILNTKVDFNNMPVAKKRDIIISRPPIAAPEILDKVYRIFARGMAFLNKPHLADSHVKKLKDHYGLSDEEIQKDELFSWPTSAITKKLMTELFTQGITENDLALVPGFFMNKETETWEFYRPKNTGAIGVPIRNVKGQIVGLQIRLDRKKENSQRYQWFSSAFADGRNTSFIKGSSPGSPIDVIYPDTIKSAAIFVTEGHFKAIKLSNQFGAIVLSVQGVSNWRQIPAVLEDVRKTYPMLRHIYIAYDADMAYKETVLSPAMKLGLTLTGLSFEALTDDVNNILAVGYRDEENSNLNSRTKAETISKYLVQNPVHRYIVNFCLWDDRYGKGIDDLIMSGHISDIRKMSLVSFWNNAFDFLEAADKLRKKISEKENIPFKSVPLEENDKRTLFQKHIFSKI